jgi:16S rRNA (guanine527-N7)-methyltransferase
LSDRQQAERLVDVSRETWGRIDRLVDLLLHWQKTINLVAPASLPLVWTRHVADSLQLLAHAPHAKHWVDLGSGGGFPGLALACALVDVPGGRIDLIESDSRKCAFLRECLRTLGLPGRVHNKRIEEALVAWDQPVEAVTARALAPLSKLLPLAFPLLKTGARGLFPKGQDVEAELTEASKSWIIDAELRPSVTESRARIVVVERLKPRLTQF